MPLLDGQNNISKTFPMPVDDMSTSTSVVSVTGETVSLYYSNSGTRTIDAGQAAGTAVVGTFANKMILDSDGAYVANWKNKSLSFTGDCFTSELPFDYQKAEKYKENTWANKLSGMTSGFSNGQYCIDYEHGIVYGVKATATASLTSTAYSINQAQTGGSTTLPSAVNLEKINNVDIPLDDAAFTPATSPVMPVGYFADETAPDSVTEGDIGAARMTLDRRVITAGQTTDDAAPETGTRVNMIGGLFDDTATDSVDEGDAGYARISGDRKLIPAGAYVDDTAFTPAGANSYVSLIGAEADETTPDSIDEGDAGALRMTLDRRLITASNILDDAAFGIGTSYVSPVGFLADEATPDSVDEGDVGLARMTLTRKIITASNFLEDTAHTTADYGNQVLAVRKDTATVLSDTDGDYTPLIVNASGALWVKQSAAVELAEIKADDGSFSIGVDKVFPSGYLADEAATDSVDEGDIGLARMTLNRRVITAGQLLDDSAFGIGTDYVTPMGCLVDDSGTDSVDEGDVGLPRMSSTRVLYTQGSVPAAATDSGNPLKIGGKFNSTQPTYTDGQRGDIQIDSRGNLRVSLESVIDSVNDSIASYSGASATVTGMSTYYSGNSGITGATATQVKSAAGNLYGFSASTAGSSAVSYLQFHDLATGSVTPGTTVPKQSYIVPADGVRCENFNAPIAFATAITIVSSTTPGGGVAPGTNLLVNINYK